MAKAAAKRKTKAEPASETTEAPAPVITYKGFNADWTCRDFKFEVGKTYKHDGPVEPCESGFHACLDPFDVLSYYSFDGKFAEVIQSGETKPHKEDSKIASAEITIKAELSIPQFIQRGVDYLLSKVDWKNAKEANTGDRSAATNTGYQSAATNTGDQSAATNTGKNGVALASGYAGRVMGAMGCALFLVERDDNYVIISAWAGIVGKDGIEPDVFYTLKNGKPEKS